MTDILLYTDIGDDIDDTLALCYLLEYTNHNIIAIVTSHGDTIARTQEAQHICRYYNTDIPIIPGVQTDFDNVDNQPSYINQLEKLVSGYNNITIVCIGPPTDLALSHSYIPNLGKITQHIIFQGDLKKNKPDIIDSYNFKCDPQAAQYCHEIHIPKTYVSKQEAYKHPLTENDLATFSQHKEINTYLVEQAKHRHQIFKQRNPQKREEIYGIHPEIISFPYDLMTVKKIDSI